MVGGYASRRAAMLAEYSDNCLPSDTRMLASRGGGKMASAGCRCKRGGETVAVEVLYCAAVQVQHSWQALGKACDVLRWDETK